jgi:hypothetical protein
VNGRQDQVHIATSDEEGFFQFGGLEPGSYILLARGYAGANDAYWEGNFKVRSGESLQMKLASPHAACLDYHLRRQPCSHKRGSFEKSTESKSCSQRSPRDVGIFPHD